jgi:Spy/CpxP family protein refolding chaperone
MLLMFIIWELTTQTIYKEAPMFENSIRKMILVFVAFAVAGFAVSVSAEMGQGYGYNQRWHHGPGMHHSGYGFRGHGGYWDNLTEAQVEKIQAERKAFFEATKELRQQIYQKRLELRSELAKKEPDSEKAIALQKEISELKGQMGLKRLDHILKLKEINPDVGRGRGRYGMMGGPRGYGGCSNPPAPRW